jgi:hypothetical protein
MDAAAGLLGALLAAVQRRKLTARTSALPLSLPRGLEKQRWQEPFLAFYF